MIKKILNKRIKTRPFSHGFKGESREMQTALHEAGHALIDLIYGFLPKKASIIPHSHDGNYFDGGVEYCWHGYTDFETWLSVEKGVMWPRERITEYYCQFAMAGIMAGAFYSGVFDWDGAKYDFEGLGTLLTPWYEKRLPSLQPHWDKTFQIIEDHKSLMGMIAMELLEKKILHEYDFQRIYQLYKQEQSWNK